VAACADDFGTGTNSLVNLKGLPVARLKIDGSFVLDVLTSRRSVAAVQSIVQLAKGEGMDTVAEFVETLAIIIARCDELYPASYRGGGSGSLEHAIERGRAYIEAGADA
jgi:predicted signal transduction protein with EAL and GGDEF domain